jgi:hypothetical protein
MYLSCARGFMKADVSPWSLATCSERKPPCGSSDTRFRAVLLYTVRLLRLTLPKHGNFAQNLQTLVAVCSENDICFANQ